MSSFVVYEAFVVGFKEALKIGLVWLVVYSYLSSAGKKALIKPFSLGTIVSILLSATVFLLSPGSVNREYLGNLVSMTFALVFLASGASLINSSGVDLLEPVRIFSRTVFPSYRSKAEGETLARWKILAPAIFISAVLFFGPDEAGSGLFLRDLSVMKEAVVRTYMSALIGALLAACITVAFSKLFTPERIGGFFAFPQVLLFLAIVKLLGGGTRGLTEISLIPSVQRGFMKFSHDFVHQTLVSLMVPDHPLLKTTTWNFIGILFGVNLASIASLGILLFLPLLFIYDSLFKGLPEPKAQTGAERRKIKYLLLSGRKKRALPVFFFICLIVALWFGQGGESAIRLYNPRPRPVVEDRGLIVIPVKDPTMDLMDGAIHKFSMTYHGEEIRILIVKKSTNVLSVCLDACEICPPEGYGQNQGTVICIYCNTPIPIETLGEPGGCNPIPLSATVDNVSVRIEFKEILKKWEYVKSGKGREVVR